MIPASLRKGVILRTDPEKRTQWENDMDRTLWRISFDPALMPGFLEQNKIHPATPIAIGAPSKKKCTCLAGRQDFCKNEIWCIRFAYRILRKDSSSPDSHP